MTKRHAGLCAAVILSIGCVTVVSITAQQRGAPGSTMRAGTDAPTWKPTIRRDGQPDIAGYYQTVSGRGGAGLTVETLIAPGSSRATRGIVVDPVDGKIPYLAWARARRDEVLNSQLHPTPAVTDTRTRGWPDGVPRITFYWVNPFQILQSEEAVVILYEAQHEFRYIPLDGRPHIDDGVKLWMGSSRGHWEGNTLVVEVRNISDRVRYSVMGDFASNDVRITERWHWLDRDTVMLTATFEDPKVFSRPWTVGDTVKRVTEQGFELMEYAGVEGDRDAGLQIDIPATLRKDLTK
jgi:hypothetical protein